MLFLFIGSAIHAQEKKRIVVVANGVGFSDISILNTFIDDFQEILLYATDEVYDVRNGQDQFLRFVDEELQLQATGLVSDEQLADVGKRLGAQLICGIVVEKDSHDGDYYFRAKIVDVESVQLIGSSRYPNELIGDKKIDELSRYNRQKSSLYLIERVGILNEDRRNSLRERIKKLEALEDQQQADIERQIERGAKKQSSINLFKPYSSFTFEVGGSSRGFETGITVDFKFISVGGGIYSGDNRQFPINSTQDHYIIKEVSPYFYGGFNFKYFGFGIKPTFYLLNSSEYIKSASYTTEYIYEKQRLDTIINAYTTTLLGFTPVIRIHLPFADWGRFSRSEKGPYGGLGISVGYAMIPKIAHNPGLDFTAGITIFW